MATGVWAVHCDGSAVPNPGRMGLGAVLVAPDGLTRHTASESTAFTGCNNEAELRALLLALRTLAQHDAARTHPVRIYCDSSVLVAQLGSAPAPPIARLAPLFDAARAQLAAAGAVSLHWVPRHRNAEADALARAALGLAPKLVQPRKKRR